MGTAALRSIGSGSTTGLVTICSCGKQAPDASAFINTHLAAELIRLKITRCPRASALTRNCETNDAQPGQFSLRMTP